MPAALFLAMALSGASAGEPDPWSDESAIITEFGFEGGVIVSPGPGETVLALAEISFSADYVFASGIEAGVETVFAFQKDHPARDGFSGVIAAHGSPGPVTPAMFPGVIAGLETEQRAARFSLETGFLYAQGGYGELRTGFDKGIAARFWEGGPELFLHSALQGPALDPFGTSLSRTDHDLTGPAFKVSYATPRLLGLQAGMSFTPEADRRGLDRDPVRKIAGRPATRPEDAFELALNLSRRLPASGTRFRFGAAYSEASGVSGDAGSRRSGNWSIGGSAEGSHLSLGGSYFSSDNGLEGAGDYSAWAFSASVPFRELEAGVGFTRARDRVSDLESDAWQFGLAWEPSPRWRLAGAWREVDTHNAAAPERFLSGERAESGIVIEITRRR